MLDGSASGGLLTLVLEGLLQSGMVDGVIHVTPALGERLFRYQVSRSVAEIRAARKSSYYATTLTDCLNGLTGAEGRYAIVGVPCFIKAARLLADQDPQIGRRLTLYLGIICGHMKSPFFAQSLAWQAGVPPRDLKSIDFRVKEPGKRADRYSFRAVSWTGDTRTSSPQAVIDGSWGFGAFQPSACDFCDDLFAETADAAFGDAWLPRYARDARGTSLVVIRDSRILGLLQASISRLAFLHELSDLDAVTSQAGLIRHRREGLRVRLADDIAAGRSVPKKRVVPGYNGLNPTRIALIRQRRAISAVSLRAFARAVAQMDFNLYRSAIVAEIKRYRIIEARSKGLLGFAKYLARSVLGRI